MEVFDVIKFEDLLATLIENKDKLSGLQVYAFNVFAAGTKVAIRAYSPNMRGKELIGLDVIESTKQSS